jgi:hypothetical protein
MYKLLFFLGAFFSWLGRFQLLTYFKTLLLSIG